MILAGPALIALSVVLFRRSEANRRRARKTRGEVLESGTRHVTDGWQPAICYRYTVEGKAFTSDRVDPPPGHRIGTGLWARRVARRYPAGAEVTVFYLPDRPQVAFLEARRELIWLIPAVLGVLLMVLGVMRMTGGA